MVLYSIILFIFVFFTIFNLLFLPDLSLKSTSDELVSVLIPMRNEERNVKDLIHCLQKLTYKNIEFILIDDNSTDNTLIRLKEAIQWDSRFKVINGKPLPAGWTGKVYACHQLSFYASGEYYFYLDADVRISSSIVEKVLYQLKKSDSGLVSGFPRFPVHPFLGKMLVPFQHFLVYFHLPLFIANHTKREAFTAAHGAFMFFKKEAYEGCGGHKSVKSSLIEDVHIARKMKKNGWKVTLVNNSQDVECHMYDTNEEVWTGFKKCLYWIGE